MTRMRAILWGFVGGWLAVAAWLLLGFADLLPGLGVAQIGQPSDSSFERRVREALLSNPQILDEARQRQESLRQQALDASAARVIAARASDIFNDAADPLGGNLDGDVSLVEFFDYNCPYCRKVAPILIDIRKEDDGLRLVYKEWPILGPGSEFAARAALAARRQGKYPAFHDALMRADGRVEEASVLDIAAAVGLDVAQLRLDMQAPEIAETLKRNRSLAADLGITGTPTFVIGDRLLRGAAGKETIADLIRQARER